MSIIHDDNNHHNITGKASKKTPTPTPADDESSHDEHDDGAAGAEDAVESDHQSVASQPKKTKVRTDLNGEEEDAMADWLGDHPELHNKKLNAYKDKVKWHPHTRSTPVAALW